jgi:hypothetical protein
MRRVALSRLKSLVQLAPLLQLLELLLLWARLMPVGGRDGGAQTKASAALQALRGRCGTTTQPTSQLLPARDRGAKPPRSLRHLCSSSEPCMAQSRLSSTQTRMPAPLRKQRTQLPLRC